MATAAPAQLVTGMDMYFARKVRRPPFNGSEEMQYEGVRLMTFKDWPGWGAVWPTLLAKAGFFYTKTADQVACFCCGGRLKTWEAGDSPMTEHKRFFPKCRFVTGRDNRNVPLGGSPPVTSGGQDRQRRNTHAPSDYYNSLTSYAGASATTNDRPSSSLVVSAQVQQQAPRRGQRRSVLGPATGGLPRQQPRTRRHTRNGPFAEAPEVSSEGRGGHADSHQRAETNSSRPHPPPTLQSLQVQLPRQADHDPTAVAAILASVMPRVMVGPHARLVPSSMRRHGPPLAALGSGDTGRITDTREVAQNQRQSFFVALTAYCPPGSHLPQQLLQLVWSVPHQRNGSHTHLEEVSAVVSAADGNPVIILATPVDAQGICDVCRARGLGVRGCSLPCVHLNCETCAVTLHQYSRCRVCDTTIGAMLCWVGEILARHPAHLKESEALFAYPFQVTGLVSHDQQPAYRSKSGSKIQSGAPKATGCQLRYSFGSPCNHADDKRIAPYTCPNMCHGDETSVPLHSGRNNKGEMQ